MTDETDKAVKLAFTFAFAAGFKVADETSRSCISAMQDAWEAWQAIQALPDGLFMHNGVESFHCRVCEAVTPFEGDDVADFDFESPTNVCGGSPRCCP